MFSVAIVIDDRPGILARHRRPGRRGRRQHPRSQPQPHDRFLREIRDPGMLIEARDNDHAREIRAHLEGAGFALKEAEQS